MYDLVVIGGGTAGCATAISAAKEGLKVLIVEKNSFLGGSMTGALVTPMMKNQLANGNILSGNFAQELMQKLQASNNSLTFSDNNNGWFNPEMLKCILDDLCEQYGVKIYFDSILCSAKISNNQIESIEILNCGQKKEIKSKYFVDTTGNGDLCAICNLNYDNGNNTQNQAMTLRFIAANVDIEKLAEFLETIDEDKTITPISKINNQIHLSTACTWDNKNWKLRPLFEKAVKDNILKEEDCAYFQIFTIPNQIGAIAFNAPRIFAEKNLNPLDVEDTSYALIQGRKQIRRLFNFCQKYLKGFENAYISQIAPMLGIRDSRRIEGEYKLCEEDILNTKKFKSAVAKSNYPIDVHSYQKDKSLLTEMQENEYYEIPLESLKSKTLSNLYFAGKIISTTFLAQASIRIIPNCLSMGESLGKFLAQQT